MPLYVFDVLGSDTSVTHCFSVNVGVDANEPRAMKFVVQRSNQHIAISFIKHF